MDGARQIVIPATVSLLCICIVFVPMFNLGGVAGYLFRPMAEAVVFALVASYVLSRTLVQHDGALSARRIRRRTDTERAAPPTRNPLVLFQRGFERRFEAARAFYRRLLVTALAARGCSSPAFWSPSPARSRSRPYLGQNFFPPVANAPDQAARARADRNAHRGHRARSATGSKRQSGGSFRRDALGPIVDNIGLPVSGINPTYNNSGTVGPADADILITIKPDYESEADGYVTKHARDPAEALPGHDLRVPARRHRHRRFSISACPRRSTCRSSGRISTPTTLTPTNC